MTSANQRHRAHHRLFSTQRVGAYGVVAALGLLGAPALLPRCAPAPAPAATSAALPVTNELVALVNQQRAAAGLTPVSADPALTAAAEGHSRYQASRGTMTHTGSGGTNAGQRILNAGFRWSSWGENVAAGQPDASAVFGAWMASAGHRANILAPQFRVIGVSGVPAANGTIYWTMDLAS